ncbi:MAG: AMP-binding protein [Lachnospiraceae bacterium]|nr:AMP-binding protein [Lachnospiraceae bacterium]
MSAITYENTLTIRELLEKSEENFASLPFLRYEKDDLIYNISYGSFAGLCRIIGSFINDLRKEYGRQVHVGFFGSSSAHYVSALIGTMASGNVAVPLDYQMDLEHLTECLKRAEVDILFYDRVHEPLISDVKENLPSVKAFYSLQSVKKTPCLNDILKNPAYTGKTWAEGSEDPVVEKDTLAMVLFTSGTTGHSKGVMLTHHNLVGNTLSQERVDYPGKPVALSVLPIHHVFCISVDFLYIMSYGGVTCINGEMSMLAKHLLLFDPMIIRMVPMIAKALYNKIATLASSDPSLTEEDVVHQVYGKSLFRIVCGGGGLSPELAQKYTNFGINIGQGYGMSECSPIISEPVMNRPDKVTSAGKVLDHVEVRIADDGEIQVRSPFVMQGYMNDPELTKEAFTEDKWLRTGDIGYVDDEGFLYLTGRLKNLIILSNGENVAPEEIEDSFISEPLISDIIVYGENDMISCEIYPDFLYAEKKDIRDIELELNRIVREHNEGLPPFKRILHVRMRKSPFKKTTSGKIIRNVFLEEKRETKDAVKNLRKPETDTEKKIYDCCAEILGHKRFGIDSDLYTQGLDSFGSILLITNLKEQLDYTLTLPELMENPTVSGLAILLAKKENEEKVDLSIRDKYPLAPTQMYFAYVIRGNTTGNLPYFLKLDNRVDLDRLENAIRGLFRIHPALSGRIEPGENGMLEFFRDDEREPLIERGEYSEEEWEEKKETLLKPFMYTKGENLYHAGIYKAESGKYLFLDVAHIIGDGMTMNILFEDLNALYANEEVKKSDYSYYEYILDDLARAQGDSRIKEAGIYVNLMQGWKVDRSILAKMNSYDLTTAHYAAIRGGFTSVSKRRLQGFCSRYGVSENAVFLTAFSYAVSLYADSDDVTITSIHSGRIDGRWSRIAGCLFRTYVFRYKKIKHEKVEELLKRNAAQILRTMNIHFATLHADEMFIQYQGDILEVPQVGGMLAERVPQQLDSLPFHLMIHSTDSGYTYELRYWENRYDREMLTIFLSVMENILKFIPDESSVRKLKDRLPQKLFPRNFIITGSDLNTSLGMEVIDKKAGDIPVKAYVLDEYGLKKPYGAWGRLYILGSNVKGTGDTIESLYTEGTLHDTGIVARITPDKELEALYQSGRIVLRESLAGQTFVDLYELESALKRYPGIKDAKASIIFGQDTRFYIRADLTCEKAPEKQAIQDYVAEKLGKYMIPEVVEFTDV